MSAVSREVLQRLPKAELHCHLDGSVRASTLIELGRELGVPMPEQSPAALAHHMYVRDARHLEDYLTRFDVTLSVMQDERSLDRITYELATDAAADGVVAEYQGFDAVRYLNTYNFRDYFTSHKTNLT